MSPGRTGLAPPKSEVLLCNSDIDAGIDSYWYKYSTKYGTNMARNMAQRWHKIWHKIWSSTTSITMTEREGGASTKLQGVRDGVVVYGASGRSGQGSGVVVPRLRGVPEGVVVPWLRGVPG